jgi:hypothetical protein
MSLRGRRPWAGALAMVALLVAPAAARAQDPVRCEPLGEGPCRCPGPTTC